MSGKIEIQAIVSGATHKGLVQLRWGSMSGQLTPEEAREHALSIIEAAEAARHDEMVFRFLMEKLNLEPARAALIIKDLRDTREQIEAEQKPS